MRTSTLPLALLVSALSSACGTPETGIDRTFIRGALEIPAGQLSEDEPEQGANDETGTAVDLGYIGARYTVIGGVTSEFRRDMNTGLPTGDLDYYRLSPLQDGTLTLAVDYPEAGTDLEETEYYAAVYDLDALTEEGEPTLLTSGSSAGGFGHLELSFDVLGGGNYAILVGGTKDVSGGDGSYTLTLDGFDPNESGFLVGAYLSDELNARGNPIGGADVPALVLDEETLTWSGSYEIVYTFILNNEPAADTGEFPTISADTTVTDAYLFGGNFASLNAGITAGTLYSSEPVAVDLSAAKEEDIEDGFFGTGVKAKVLEGVTVTVDSIQPKIYGWTTVDAEPNNFADHGDGYKVIDLAGAQETPEASGAGVVDVITGTLDFAADNPEWIGEIDAYTITVPSSLAGFFSLAWADTSYNLDLNLYDSTGALIGAGWGIADVNPEKFNSLADYGFTLEPGQTYYVAIFPWSGAAGAVDYTLEIEWLAP